MRDGPLRRAIKAAVRAVWAVEVGARRRLDPPSWRLAGTCEGCGACCERPTLRVGWWTWRMRSLRAIFLLWQRHINGFELMERDRRARAFVFTCTHYDPQTRLCDSYDSRPFACRDYPRALLHQPWPELFADCTHRVVHRDGGGLLDAVEALDLKPGQAVQLKRDLRLD